MGGDSAAAMDDYLETRRDPKVWTHGRFLIGCIHSARAAQLVQHSFQAPRRLQNVSVPRYMATSFVDGLHDCLKRGRLPDDDLGKSQFLIGYDGRIFRIDGDHAVAEVTTPWDAIGSGSESARGALLSQDVILTQARRNKRPFVYPAQQRVMDALSIAERLTTNVRKPFTIVRSG